MALDVVRNAEGALRELMQSAVDAGEYNRVAVLARWAEQLSQIGVNGADSVNGAKPAGFGARRSNGTVERKMTTRRKSKQAKSKYPMFKRSGDNLVKVAWSRTSKSEYQHQASKAIVLDLVAKMHTSQNDDSLVTMDDVLPLMTDGDAEVPSYQSYACLAWLRSIGVVEQHGRQGYSIVDETAARELTEQRWRELPMKR